MKQLTEEYLEVFLKVHRLFLLELQLHALARGLHSCCWSTVCCPELFPGINCKNNRRAWDVEAQVGCCWRVYSPCGHYYDFACVIRFRALYVNERRAV